jgi:hypothetical protein
LRTPALALRAMRLLDWWNSLTEEALMYAGMRLWWYEGSPRYGAGGPPDDKPGDWHSPRPATSGEAAARVGRREDASFPTTVTRLQAPPVR